MMSVLHYQGQLVSWALAQSIWTGLVLLVAGLVAGCHGLRIIRFLLVVICSGIGFGAGLALGETVGIYPQATAIPGAVVAGMSAVAWPRHLAVLANAVTWGGLAAYLAAQLGLKGAPAWIGIALLASGGLVLGIVSPRAMGMIMTSLYGAALFVLGFFVVADTLVPAIGSTLRGWTSGRSLFMPILLCMLATTAYSYQANCKPGDGSLGRLGGSGGNHERPRPVGDP